MTRELLAVNDENRWQFATAPLLGCGQRRRGGAGAAPGVVAAAVCAALFAGGCSEFFRNQSASLGGDQAGDRGNLRVLFINNTPQRAVFTYGTYDQGNPDFQPDFEQFGPLDGDLNLDGDSSSAIRTVPCGRVFAIGSDGLTSLISENVDGTVIDEALVQGVEFFDLNSDDNADTLIGAADPLEALLGVDFACNGLLIIYLESGAGANEFRLDFQVIPSESDR